MVDTPPVMCELCSLDVPPDDLVSGEMSVAGAMCPTAMNFHTACYERVKDMWQFETDSVCQVDPDFPETQRWTPVEDG